MSDLFIVDSQGREYDLNPPRIGDVGIFDISWSLGQLNRFTGRCIRPYSVAEHSLLVCEIAEREHGLDVHGLLCALMHDAHEAYTGDLHSPGKRIVGGAWQAFEDAQARNVATAFALRGASVVHRQCIKQADLQALATERRDLMPPSERPWSILQGVEPIGWVRLDTPERRAMTWEDWRDRFLDRYHELDFARNEALFGSRTAPK